MKRSFTWGSLISFQVFLGGPGLSLVLIEGEGDTPRNTTKPPNHGAS